MFPRWTNTYENAFKLALLYVVCTKMQICVPVMPYEFNPSPDLSIFFFFDVRRNVPYFYDTFCVRKYIVASGLG